MKKNIAYHRVGMCYVIALLLTGCTSKEAPSNQWGGYVTISPDDKQIAFDFLKNDEISLYTANVDGSSIKPLTVAKNEYHRKPEYSPDGSKILFLSFPKNTEKPQSQLYIIDTDGSNIKQLTFNASHITEATFSPDGSKIYYLQSATFEHYSPVAVSKPHGFDIYSIDVDGSNETRITDLREYDIDGLSISFDGKTLLFCKTVAGEPVRTLHVLSLENPKEITRIDPQGDFHTDMIFNSRFSPNSKSIIFSAPTRGSKSGFSYELFLLDRATKQSKQLTSLSSQASGTHFFHNQERVLFAQTVNWPKEPAQYQLMQINLDGSDLRKINLEIQDTE